MAREGIELGRAVTEEESEGDGWEGMIIGVVCRVSEHHCCENLLHVAIVFGSDWYGIKLWIPGGVGRTIVSVRVEAAPGTERGQ